MSRKPTLSVVGRDMTTVRRPFVALLVAMAVTSCGDDGPALTAPAPATAAVTTVAVPASPAPTTASAEVVEVVEVVALDNSFRPDQLTVAAGTEVRFVNRGRNEHDALSVESDTWGVEAVDFGPGAEYVHVFDEPGTYRYYCSLHGNADVGMVGVITVEATGE
jgi:plastocyanin